MKKVIKKKNQNEILEMYPITKEVKGWYFRVQEISPGGYRVDGIDLFGREVSRMGSDPDALLEQCAQDAEEIYSKLKVDE